MADIQTVVVTLSTPTDKDRYPFIPGMPGKSTVTISKCFHSKEQLLNEIGDLLGQLAEIWEENADERAGDATD